MLTTLEKILFIILSLISVIFASKVIKQLVYIINSGTGEVDWSLARQRAMDVLIKTISFKTVFRFRFWPSVFHALVAWGFIYYLFINLGDTVEAFLEGFHFLGTGDLGGLYRLGADVLSIGILVGMLLLMGRRFLLKPQNLTTRRKIKLDQKARKGIQRDSAIVGVFILIHVGSRFLGESFEIAAIAGIDPWQPFASFVAQFWQGWSNTVIEIGIHLTFWLAIGSIFLFIPYFLYSKHLHLFLAPINYLLKPERRSMGELNRLDFEDETIEQFGASKLTELGWEQIMDSYACIMCFRCQEVCPAYNTGKVLSPAALEINKRYYLNREGKHISSGQAKNDALTKVALPVEAIWACTACGACIDICPVGNEPMRDIIDIRRSLVLMENNFPEQFKTAFRGMERTQNPWNISPTERMKWAEGFNVPTIDQNPDPEILWWVGCAPAIDIRAQKTAQAFAQILNESNVNFAVLGEHEQCTGDSARRAGNEFLFNEIAIANVDMLNQVAPGRIVTSCPHCFHTLKNEYPAFGGQYKVVHHTQLIQEFLIDGSVIINHSNNKKVTFHDPCYLGRQNGILNEPREIIHSMQENFVELPRHGRKSFCCGAGGAQMWKEEEHGEESVSINRFREAESSGVDILAVACPFCLIMLTDAKKDSNSQIEVLDTAEIISAALVSKEKI